MIYAQLNEQGFCVGISKLSNEVNIGNMILIDKYDISYLWRKYNVEKKTWTDEYPVTEETTREPDKVELLGQQLSDLEIQQLEYNTQATQEREFLGQQLSDLEISILERGL